MLVLHKNRPSGDLRVHYLRDGGVISLQDGTVVGRNGNYVIVQNGKNKFTIDTEGSVNFTTSEITVIPLERILQKGGTDAVETLRRLEEIAFEEKMPNSMRKIIRLYAALLGIKILDEVPKSYMETVVLTVSRLTGEDVGKIISEREEVLRKIREELGWTMNSIDPETLARAVNTVISV